MKWEKITSIPAGAKPGAFERALKAFVEDSHTEETGADPLGLYTQLIENVAAILILRSSAAHFMWCALKDDGEIAAFALAYVGKDIDNKLTYTITNAWADKSIRGSSLIKEWWKDMKQDAVLHFCKHILLPSSRSPKAYMRFLGGKLSPYVTLLKEDI